MEIFGADGFTLLADSSSGRGGNEGGDATLDTEEPRSRGGTALATLPVLGSCDSERRSERDLARPLRTTGEDGECSELTLLFTRLRGAVDGGGKEICTAAWELVFCQDRDVWRGHEHTERPRNEVPASR